MEGNGHNTNRQKAAEKLAKECYDERALKTLATGSVEDLMKTAEMNTTLP